MSEQYQEIDVKCPICSIEKIIKLPQNLFHQKKFGNLKVQVPKGLVCDDHPFILFLNNKAKVQGYEKIDFQYEVPIEEEMKSIDEIKKELSLNDIIKKWGTYILYNILHGYIFSYPIFILKRDDTPDLTDSLNELLSKFKPLNLKNAIPVFPIEFKSFDDIELSEDKSLLIDPSGIIIQCPWSRRSKFEEKVVKKVLDIIDIQGQNIIVKKEIEKFIIQAEKIIGILKSVKSIYDIDLIDKLSNELMQPKISNNHLIVLREFIARKYDSEIVKKIKNKVGEFLALL